MAGSPLYNNMCCCIIEEKETNQEFVKEITNIL